MESDGKEQDPTLACFSIKGVVWVGVGINQCPFLPLLGGSWKLNVTFLSLFGTNTFQGQIEIIIKTISIYCDYCNQKVLL